MAPLVVGWVMVMAAFAILLYPLMRKRPVVAPEAGSPEVEQLLSQRDATYAAIQELRFDLELGNLSPQDYRELEERYKQKAIATLKDIDRQSLSTALEDEIEAAIARLRQTKKEAQYCPQCGQSVGPQDRFCRHCGATLTEAKP